MKYSIFGMSQAELVKYNDSHPGYELDSTDLLIFAWFQHFSATKRKNGQAAMRHKIFNGKQFSMVNFMAIVEEFPFFNIKNSRTVSRRFDKYVAGGIMEKKVLKGRGIGSIDFFAFTGDFDFEYDDTDEKQKLNPHSEKQDQEDDAKPEDRDDKDVTSKKEIESTQKCSPNPKSEDRGDKDVVSKPLETTKQCTPLNNPSTIRNSSTTSTKFTEKKEAAVDFNKYLDILFGSKTSFSSDLYLNFCKYANESCLQRDKYKDYLDWAYKYLQERCHNADSFDGYFYRSVTQKALMLKFVNKHIDSKSEEKIKNEQFMIICPVCGEKHCKFDDCPKCGLSENDMKNEKELNRQIKIWNLPNNQKNRMCEELDKVKNDFLEKYGLLSFTDPKKRIELDEMFSNIYKKFNIA